MALFTKKKLSDEERQTWSAQLLEVRAAELARWGEFPTLGDNWYTHDLEWNRLYNEVYLPQYGIYAGAEMIAQGLRLSGYRRYLFDGPNMGGMIILVDELDERPADLSKGEVIWAVNLGPNEDGIDEWGWQYVSSQWKHAKSYMMARVKEWDLTNLRSQLFWSHAFNWIAKAILVIGTAMILLPVLGGAALGLALGEKVSILGLLEASKAALISGGVLATAGIGALSDWGEKLGVEWTPEEFTDADEFNQGVLVFVGNDLTIQDAAPTNGPTDSSGLGALLLAAAGLLLFI